MSRIGSFLKGAFDMHDVTQHAHGKGYVAAGATTALALLEGYAFTINPYIINPANATGVNYDFQAAAAFWNKPNTSFCNETGINPCDYSLYALKVNGTNYTPPQFDLLPNLLDTATHAAITSAACAVGIGISTLLTYAWMTGGCCGVQAVTQTRGQQFLYGAAIFLTLVAGSATALTPLSPMAQWPAVLLQNLAMPAAMLTLLAVTLNSFRGVAKPPTKGQLALGGIAGALVPILGAGTEWYEDTGRNVLGKGLLDIASIEALFKSAFNTTAMYNSPNGPVSGDEAAKAFMFANMLQLTHLLKILFMMTTITCLVKLFAHGCAKSTVVTDGQQLDGVADDQAVSDAEGGSNDGQAPNINPDAASTDALLEQQLQSRSRSASVSRLSARPSSTATPKAGEQDQTGTNAPGSVPL